MMSRIAPPTPPLATLPTMAPRSRLPPDCPNAPIARRMTLPSPPPTMPAIELPIAPKLLSFMAAPAMLPPTAPLIRLINRLTRSMLGLLVLSGENGEPPSRHFGTRAVLEADHERRAPGADPHHPSSIPVTRDPRGHGSS